MFGYTDHGFGEVEEAMLELYTTAATGAIRSARRYRRAVAVIEQLRRALESRAVIDQAEGVIMAARGVDAAGAFVVLVEQSQHQNVKVRELAERIVGEMNSGDGRPLPETTSVSPRLS
ncbi:ANTAR domain-containing protein [Rhodococcus spelaei]|uniref:ANTAR domain-containing protein n=1 Tax=Rhodococcus spelaei TaxID=2546320 RepID=UPI001FE49A32|nr:ANTAR domain-containing protein [Rhodococcus spelaei]